MADTKSYAKAYFLARQAHDAIDLFCKLQNDSPNRAWEAFVELRNLLEGLQAICPPKTFLSTSSTRKPGPYSRLGGRPRRLARRYLEHTIAAPLIEDQSLPKFDRERRRLDERPRRWGPAAAGKTL
jgi:hypothetical protein